MHRNRDGLAVVFICDQEPISMRHAAARTSSLHTGDFEEIPQGDPADFRISVRYCRNWIFQTSFSHAEFGSCMRRRHSTTFHEPHGGHEPDSIPFVVTKHSRGLLRPRSMEQNSHEACVDPFLRHKAVTRAGSLVRRRS